MAYYLPLIFDVVIIVTMSFAFSHTNFQKLQQAGFNNYFNDNIFDADFQTLFVAQIAWYCLFAFLTVKSLFIFLFVYALRSIKWNLFRFHLAISFFTLGISVFTGIFCAFIALKAVKIVRTKNNPGT